MQMREALNYLLNNAEQIREARATALNRGAREKEGIQYGSDDNSFYDRPLLELN